MMITSTYDGEFDGLTMSSSGTTFYLFIFIPMSMKFIDLANLRCIDCEQLHDHYLGTSHSIIEQDMALL